MMETREEKFKKYREEILKEKNKPQEIKEEKVEEIKIEEEPPVKKNTLTMSIDEIIEAHDEYTMIIQQKELKDKIKLEKKAKRKFKMQKVIKYILICLILVAFVVIIALFLIKILWGVLIWKK